MQTLLRIDTKGGVFAIDRTLVAVLHFPADHAPDHMREFADTDPEAITDEFQRIGVWPELLANMAAILGRSLSRKSSVWTTIHLRYAPEVGWHRIDYVEPDGLYRPYERKGVILSFNQ